jgi:peptidyl-prolyl cis-trans isomerase-like protein 2
MAVMFDELKKPVKDKDRLKSKAYATIMTNFGGLNLELHGDRAPKTVYNFVQLAKQGYYDDTIFHRLIPGFMVRPSFLVQALSNEADTQVQGGDPTGTGRGGKSYWGEPFRDELAEKGAYKHDGRGVLVSPMDAVQLRHLTRSPWRTADPQATPRSSSSPSGRRRT